MLLSFFFSFARLEGLLIKIVTWFLEKQIVQFCPSIISFHIFSKVSWFLPWLHLFIVSLLYLL